MLLRYDNLLLLFYPLQATKCTSSCYWCLKVEDNSYILLFKEYRNMIHRETKSCHERDSFKNVNTHASKIQKEATNVGTDDIGRIFVSRVRFR